MSIDNAPWGKPVWGVYIQKLACYLNDWDRIKVDSTDACRPSLDY